MEAQKESARCESCSAALAENADFCEACGGSLKPGWFCWACGEFNQPSEAKCGACKRPADTELGGPLKRRQNYVGALLLTLTVLIIGVLFFWDLRQGRNSLSTKDGDFQKRVRGWERGAAPAP